MLKLQFSLIRAFEFQKIKKKWLKDSKIIPSELELSSTSRSLVWAGDSWTISSSLVRNFVSEVTVPLALSTVGRMPKSIYWFFYYLFLGLVWFSFYLFIPANSIGWIYVDGNIFRERNSWLFTVLSDWNQCNKWQLE